MRKRDKRYGNGVRAHSRQHNLRFDQPGRTDAAVKNKLMHKVVARLMGVIGPIMLVFVMATGALRNSAVMSMRVRNLQGCSNKKQPKEESSNRHKARH
ncbi:MAG: hypothetical protein ACKVRO_14890 [Micropepsaceae bacterium]